MDRLLIRISPAAGSLPHRHDRNHFHGRERRRGGVKGGYWTSVIAEDSEILEE